MRWSLKLEECLYPALAKRLWYWDWKYPCYPFPKSNINWLDIDTLSILQQSNWRWGFATSRIEEWVTCRMMRVIFWESVEQSSIPFDLHNHTDAIMSGKKLAIDFTTSMKEARKKDMKYRTTGYKVNLQWMWEHSLITLYINRWLVDSITQTAEWFAQKLWTKLIEKQIHASHHSTVRVFRNSNIASFDEKELWILNSIIILWLAPWCRESSWERNTFLALWEEKVTNPIQERIEGYTSRIVQLAIKRA